MEAGSDTTSLTLLSFILAMISHPDALRKCQEEVDARCTNRTPGVEDIKDLPYMKAVMYEVSIVAIACLFIITSTLYKCSPIATTLLYPLMHGKLFGPYDGALQLPVVYPKWRPKTISTLNM
jgi:hypothetical protein